MRKEESQVSKTKTLSLKKIRLKAPKIKIAKPNYQKYKSEISKALGKVSLKPKKLVFTLIVTLFIFSIYSSYTAAAGELFFPVRTFAEEKLLLKSFEDKEKVISNYKIILNHRFSKLKSAHIENNCINVIVIEDELKGHLAEYFRLMDDNLEANTKIISNLKAIVQDNYFESNCPTSTINSKILVQISDLILAKMNMQAFDLTIYKDQEAKLIINEYDLQQEFKKIDFDTQETLDNSVNLFFLFDELVEKNNVADIKPETYIANLISMEISLDQQKIIFGESVYYPSWPEYISNYCILFPDNLGCESEKLNSTYNSIYQSKDISRQIKRSQTWFTELLEDEEDTN